MFDRVRDAAIEERLARIIVQGSRGALGEADELFALDLIRGFVRRELLRRGLYHAPAKFLGLIVEGTFRDRPDELESLVGEVRASVLRPRDSLLRVARRGGSATAYVRRSVRNFIHDKQEKHDPVGARVYRELTGVLHELAAAGEVALSGLRNGKLVSRSLVRLVQPGASATTGRLADPVRSHLAQVGQACLFGDLIAVLRARARAESGVPHLVASCEAGAVAAPASQTDMPRAEALRELLAETTSTGVVRLFDAMVHGYATGQGFEQKAWAARAGIPTSTVGDLMKRLRAVGSAMTGGGKI